MTSMEELAARILNPPRAPIPTNSDLDLCRYVALCSSPDALGTYLHDLTFGDATTQEIARMAIKLEIAKLQRDR